MPQADFNPVPIPSVTSRTTPQEFNDYSKGMNTYLANDVMPLNQGGANFWRLAQDARMPTLGEYETRKGADFHSDAVGETLEGAQTSTLGAADQSFNSVTRLAKKYTAASSGRLTKVELNLKNGASASGTVIVELWSDSSGPSALLAKTSIASSAIGATADYEVARFISAPAVTSGTAYWIVAYVQNTGLNSYQWTSTTAAATAMTSTDSGSTWSATAYDLNFKAYVSTNESPKGYARYTKNDGTAVSILWAGTTMYSVNESTGALTAVKTGLNASATKYRWAVVNDILYYVNEYDGYRKWDGTTESQVSATNYSLICEFKGLIFLARTDDKQRVDFTNFAAYDTFTSTDFIYVPSPKTGDPVTALGEVNGLLTFFTAKSKYVLSGDDNATFRLDPALGKKGTYTQETIASDGNYLYFLSDDGLYRFNGSTDDPLSENIFEDIKVLPNKNTTLLNVNRGRLRLYYSLSGQTYNSRCFVFSLNFNCVESHDTDTYFKFAHTSKQENDKLFVVSSLVGQVYLDDQSTNDYTNLGGDINFRLLTHYMHFGSPAVYKEVRYWKPRLEAQSDNYTITCEYATDLRDTYQTRENTAIQGSGYIWGSASTVWGSFTWGTTPEMQPDLSIGGEYRRVQVGYKHYATRQPHKFLGHTFITETRRLR